MSIIGPFARLEIARAYVMEDDTAKARAAYRDFLALWKDADPKTLLQQVRKSLIYQVSHSFVSMFGKQMILLENAHEEPKCWLHLSFLCAF